MACSVLLLSAFSTLCAQATYQVHAQRGGDVILVTATQAGRHKLEIDDAEGFRTPVLTLTFEGTQVDLRADEAGLVSGVAYHLRVDARRLPDLRLAGNTLAERGITCAALRRTWEETGRLKAGVAFSGLIWDEHGAKWTLVPTDALVGRSLYDAEVYLRPALNGARACDDRQTLDEIAQYYIAMLARTEPVGALLARVNVVSEERVRMAAATATSRTFAAPFGEQVAEAELSITQWLHPAARLLRLISQLPPEQRSPTMKAFAAQYSQFIVAEQLERYLVQQKLPAPGGGKRVGRIELWKLAMRGQKGEHPWDTAMSDIDLWLLTSAAEVLGANANDPELVPLDAAQSQMLLSALETGVNFLQSKRTLYKETQNWRGEKVGSASYFNGDYTAHGDYAFSAVTSEEFPGPTQKRVLETASWDISHACRLPTFLRALYENRKATRVEFPRYADLQLVVNQYVYRVFNADLARPLLRNYFDGSDGWYRVGYHGAQFGYPPSKFCDAHNPERPCLTIGGAMAWGQLAFVSPDLTALESALIRMALSPSPEIVQFRNRYYLYDKQPFQLLGTPSRQILGGTLYFVAADNAEMIADRGAN